MTASMLLECGHSRGLLLLLLLGYEVHWRRDDDLLLLLRLLRLLLGLKGQLAQRLLKVLLTTTELR